jgi:outer membrane protein assembly factor BamB
VNSNLLIAFIGAVLLAGCRGSPATPDAGPRSPDCSQNNGGCDPNAKCIARGASRICLCYPWYSGDGLTCTETGLQHGSPWPVQGGNDRHTGQSVYVGPQTSHQKWAPLLTEGWGFGSPVVDANGTIYIGTSGNLHAYNPDGTLKWTYANRSNHFWSTPALGANGLLYVQSDGELRAFDTSSKPNPPQRLRWSSPTAEDGFRSSPLIGFDRMVFMAGPSGDPSGQIYAFDADEGTPKWTFPSGGTNDASPVLTLDGDLVIPAVSGLVYGLTAKGEQRWSIPFSEGGSVASPVTGPDGTVFLGTFDGTLYSIDPTTGASQSIKIANEILSLAIDAEGTLYAGTQSQIIAITYSAGWHPDWRKWVFPISNIQKGVSGIAIDAEGTIYVNAEKLYALNPDGTLKWIADSIINPVNSPTIAADGTLYVQDVDGTLYAVGN